MTAKEKMQTAIHKAVKIDHIPTEKAGVMIQRTVVGALIAGVGVVGLLKFEMNHWLATGMILLGATTWSTQVVTGAMKALVEPLAALFNVWRGK